MKSKKAWIRAAAVVLALAVLTVGTLISDAASSLALDASQTVVYQNIETESILDVFQINHLTAQRNFDGRSYVVWGEISDKAQDRKSFTLQDTSKQGVITCESRQVIGGLEDLQAGDRVKVYGKIKVTVESELFSWIQPAVTMSVDKVEKTTASQALRSTFSLLDGTGRNRDSMEQRTVGENAFVYYIPEAWAAVESELPNVAGYQYKLNNLSGKGAAESLFLFYVDGSCLERSGDISKTTQVQKAIIRNILGSNSLKIRPEWSFLDSDIRMSQIEAGYCKFTGYSGWYTDPNRQNYRVEFLFLPSDGKGIRALLYVYKTAEHANDILFMMRMMFG